MKKYEVYLKSELRDKCDCGRCVNHKGFKTTLSTWHAVPLFRSDDIDLARGFKNENPGTIILEEEQEYFKQLKDQVEVF